MKCNWCNTCDPKNHLCSRRLALRLHFSDKGSLKNQCYWKDWHDLFTNGNCPPFLALTAFWWSIVGPSENLNVKCAVIGPESKVNWQNTWYANILYHIYRPSNTARRRSYPDWTCGSLLPSVPGCLLKAARCRGQQEKAPWTAFSWGKHITCKLHAFHYYRHQKVLLASTGISCPCRSRVTSGLKHHLIKKNDKKHRIFAFWITF